MKKQQKEMSYLDSVHRAGRIWNLCMMLAMFLYPILVGLIYGAAPDGHGLVMAYSYYGELVPMVVSALSGCLFFAALSNCLQSRYLEYLGQNTLFIYLFHFFLWAYPLPRLLGKVMTVGTTAYNWLYALLLFGEVLVIFSLLIPVYNRIMQPLQRSRAFTVFCVKGDALAAEIEKQSD